MSQKEIRQALLTADRDLERAKQARKKAWDAYKAGIRKTATALRKDLVQRGDWLDERIEVVYDGTFYRQGARFRYTDAVSPDLYPAILDHLRAAGWTIADDERNYGKKIGGDDHHVILAY